MAAEAARVLDFDSSYYYGSSVPAEELYPEAAPRSPEIQDVGERTRQRERAKSAEHQRAPGVSIFAVFGAAFLAVLMVFVILAQIRYNEAAAEKTRLSTQVLELTEQHRKLEIAFESVIDMKEIERYARDVLGMSKPENYQMAVIQNVAGDKAEVLAGGEAGSLREFGSFISSLFEYFR